MTIIAMSILHILMEFTLTESLVYLMKEESIEWAIEFLKSTNNSTFAEINRA